MGLIRNKQATFDSWDGGNWGANGSLRAQPGQYRAVNMQRYANGSIGPRPGWKELTTTGTGPNTAGASVPQFRVVWVPSASGVNGYLLHLNGSGAGSKRLNMDTLAWASCAAGTTYTDPNSGPAESNFGSVEWLNPTELIINASIRYNPTADTVGAALSYPSGFVPRRAIFYKTRLYAWGDATFTNRVYFSNDGDLTTFVAGQYFDVGSGGSTAATRPRIMGCWNVNDALLIQTIQVQQDSQPLGEWWLLSGASPLTGSLRRIASGLVPLYPSYGAAYGGLVLAMDHSRSKGALVCDGSQLDRNTLIRLRPGCERAVTSKGRNLAVNAVEPSVIMPYVVTSDADPTGDPIGDFYLHGVQAWELVHGVWTQALYWNGATDAATPAGSNYPFLTAVEPFAGDKLLSVTVASAGADGVPAVYSRDVCLDRPSRTDDTWSDPNETSSQTTGDGLTCSLYLPDLRSEDGFGVSPRRVIVDFDYWKAAEFVPANEAGLTLRVVYRNTLNRSDDEITDEYESDTDYLADTDATPKQGRYVWRLPNKGYWGSFQLQFTNIRNVAIDKVTVFYDENPDDPS